MILRKWKGLFGKMPYRALIDTRPFFYRRTRGGAQRAVGFNQPDEKKNTSGTGKKRLSLEWDMEHGGDNLNLAVVPMEEFLGNCVDAPNIVPHGFRGTFSLVAVNEQGESGDANVIQNDPTFPKRDPKRLKKFAIGMECDENLVISAGSLEAIPRQCENFASSRRYMPPRCYAFLRHKLQKPELKI